MEIKKYMLVGSLIACLIVASCANSQEKYDKLKLTAYKLLNFLKDRDSLKITQLFEDRDMLLRKENILLVIVILC